MTQTEKGKVKLAAKSLRKRLTAAWPNVLVAERYRHWHRHPPSKLRAQHRVAA